MRLCTRRHMDGGVWVWNVGKSENDNKCRGGGGATDWTDDATGNVTDWTDDATGNVANWTGNGTGDVTDWTASWYVVSRDSLNGKIVSMDVMYWRLTGIERKENRCLLWHVLVRYICSNLVAQRSYSIQLVEQTLFVGLLQARTIDYNTELVRAGLDISLIICVTPDRDLSWKY